VLAAGVADILVAGSVPELTKQAAAIMRSVAASRSE
jgi:hypothetical protein